MDKVELTEERWTEFWKRQQEREAKEREAVRLAVASSSVPLSSELVSQVIGLPDGYFQATMREHPGYPYAERRNTYQTSLSILEMSLEDLIVAISDFERRAIAENTTLFSHHGRDELDAIERRMQKDLFTTVNAAASLVDHSRRLQSRFQFADNEKQLSQSFGGDGLHKFVIGLRVLHHHLRIVQAGWLMHTSFSKNTKTATFTINKEALQRAISQHPERFGGEQGKPILAYLDAAPRLIDLREVFEEYGRRVRAFHAWIATQLASESLIALRDYDRVMQERRNFGSRIWWGALIGNWLHNWKVPPNPHDHLHKYLTAQQLEEVYALPRNSKEQVDLVIHYVDTDRAIDDKLREEVYELFRRSPPAS